MIIGPKYKIARRLEAPVFEKTQSQKFVMASARRSKTKGKGAAQRSDYSSQMLEKQKARYTYLLSEKQFANYVKKAFSKKGARTIDTLFENLELRLDNVVSKLGLANTRAFGRQIVSHGHILVNNKRVNIPSFGLSIGDKIAIRPASLKKKMFDNFDERIGKHSMPLWIKFDPEKKEALIQSIPKIEGANLLFDLNSVIEFYNR